MRFRNRLNPFDIRASVRTIPIFSMYLFCDVSIPLISGHQSGRARYPRYERRYVSIPLISGHQSGQAAPALAAEAASQSL